MRSSLLLGLLAETPLHPGASGGRGVVDLPVAREAATDYPVLVASGLKGALRDRAAEADLKDQVFGLADRAGELLVCDGRLLLLPVRSLTGAYRWLTCPHLLERYRRDLQRAGLSPLPDLPRVESGRVLTAGEGQLILEERHFSIAGPVPPDLLESIKHLILHTETRERLSAQVAIVHDDDFAWFVRYGLPLQARNVLENETKQSQNLWYEESLPPDTLLYALLLGRSQAALELIRTLVGGDNPYLQAGGNETLGQGWMAVKLREGRV